MKKIRAAVVGYGNVGRFALEALEAAPDFEVSGIVRRKGALNKPLELSQYEVVDDIKKLKNVAMTVFGKQVVADVGDDEGVGVLVF